MSSDLVWQALAVAVIRLRDNLELELGYRHMDYDYDRELVFDMELSGAIVGLGMTF